MLRFWVACLQWQSCGGSGWFSLSFQVGMRLRMVTWHTQSSRASKEFAHDTCVQSLCFPAQQCYWQTVDPRGQDNTGNASCSYLVFFRAQNWALFPNVLFVYVFSIPWNYLRPSGQLRASRMWAYVTGFVFLGLACKFIPFDVIFICLTQGMPHVGSDRTLGMEPGSQVTTGKRAVTPP